MRYAFIESLRAEFSVKNMTGWLDVSRAGYYKWRLRQPSFQEEYRELVRAAVLDTFSKLKARYGAPRLTLELHDQGVACSVNHVAKLMSEAGLKARNGKNFRYSPDGSTLNNVSKNLLDRDFEASKPNEKWVSDITYIPIKGGHVYLAVIMDLFSRKIIGWSLDKTMTTGLITNALNMATATRECEPGLLLHSDQGVQYRSADYVLAMHDANITPRMSRRGSCWDNAAMESFFSRLKVEEVSGKTFNNLNEVYSSVFEYIEMFYNRVRKHSANDHVSPVEYEQYYYEECA
ncbi:IS3 family transposase [Agaribacterium sp. ZY112]|uniref:IS3 family transposase n=1 Tax=Agaribacterium sp. ZY112 TaxID=3233574 RepID=UPI003523E1BF